MHTSGNTTPPVTWVERFRAQLADALGHGAPSLASVAHQLAVSPRTLQRRLAEHGTTWREELDCARRHRARLARLSGMQSIANLTSQLGYEDPRSARRALRRWASAPGDMKSCQESEP